MNLLYRIPVLSIVALVAFPLLLRAQGRLSVYDIDASAFPTVAGKMLPLDDAGNPVTGLVPGDIVVTENGVNRPVKLVDCDDIAPPGSLSVAVSIDASSSMDHLLGPPFQSSETPFLAGKGTAGYLAGLLRFPLDEMAVQSFSGGLMGLLPFTRSTTAVVGFVRPLPLGLDNNFTGQLLAPGVGLVDIVKGGSGRRIALLLTDSDFNGSLAPSLATMEAIRDSCLEHGVSLYVIVFDNSSVPGPSYLSPLIEETGGKLYSGISSEDEARAAIRAIVDAVIPPKSACRLEWESLPGCPVDRHVVITIPGRGLSTSLDYQLPDALVAGLTFDPPALNFGPVAPGASATMGITLTAGALPVGIASLTTSDPRFTILDGGAPPAFTLGPGESRTVTVGFTPTDPTPFFGELVIGAADLCLDPGRMVGGSRPVADPLRVVEPNGGEVYAVGSNELIRWEGVPFAEKVRIEYSTDAGGSWGEIAAAASGLGHPWTVPPTPSHNCLLRVTRTGPPPAAQPDVAFVDPSHGITACAFAPAGDLVATGGRDSTLRIWSAATGALVRAFPQQRGAIISVEFSPAGHSIATGSSRGEARIWDLSTGALVTTLTSYMGSAVSASFSPDGGRIVLAEDGGWITLWSPPVGAPALDVPEAPGDLGALQPRRQPDRRGRRPHGRDLRCGHDASTPRSPPYGRRERKDHPCGVRS
jgi:hypothetical protein